MENIKEAIYSKNELTNDQIVDAFRNIGSIGDLFIIKNDGLRIKDNFTVVISSPADKFESIRYDDDSLNIALIKCLRKYFEVSTR